MGYLLSSLDEKIITVSDCSVHGPEADYLLAKVFAACRVFFKLIQFPHDLINHVGDEL
jgi:hypothetical protein